MPTHTDTGTPSSPRPKTRFDQMPNAPSPTSTLEGAHVPPPDHGRRRDVVVGEGETREKREPRRDGRNKGWIVMLALAVVVLVAAVVAF